MVKRTIKLEQLNIPNPCTNNWEQMAGNNQVRFCNQCRSQVFDLSKMTRKQVKALVTEKQENLCARITYRSDGTIQTTDDITCKVSSIQPIVKATTATIFTLISFSVLANAQTSPKANLPTIVSIPQLQNQDKEPIDRSAQIYGTIYDFSHAVISKADIKLTNETNSETYKTTADENGNYYIPALTPGFYTIEVLATGFEYFQRTSVILASNNNLHFEAILLIAPTIETIEVNMDTTITVMGTTCFTLETVSNNRIINIFKLPYRKFKKIFSNSTK